MNYILDDDNNPVPCNDMAAWGAWMEQSAKNQRRIVKQETVNGILVSTVFLGIDHNFHGHGPPILFETMYFGEFIGDYQTRCATWAEAEEMHQKALDSLVHLETKIVINGAVAKVWEGIQGS